MVVNYKEIGADNVSCCNDSLKSQVKELENTLILVRLNKYLRVRTNSPILSRINGRG